MSRIAGDFALLNEQVERALIPPIENRAQIHPPEALLFPGNSNAFSSIPKKNDASSRTGFPL